MFLLLRTLVSLQEVDYPFNLLTLLAAPIECDVIGMKR